MDFTIRTVTLVSLLLFKISYEQISSLVVLTAWLAEIMFK